MHQNSNFTAESFLCKLLLGIVAQLKFLHNQKIYHIVGINQENIQDSDKMQVWYTHASDNQDHNNHRQ